MKAYNTLNVDIIQLVSTISGANWNEVRDLGQMVDNDQYGVMASAGPR